MRRLAIAVALLVAGTASAGDLLTPAEKRGREIYLHGRSTARPITAFFGSDDGGMIDASVVPCASCHGADGRGVAEGTVAPADVRWRVLSKPFIASDGGRHRPRYDGATLMRAVREAIDAEGTPLFAVMPHYRIDDHDLDDLVAYLRRLGDEPQPGLDDDTIVIATVVSLTGPRAPAGEAFRNVISGYFDDINTGGGLFGRRLKLEVIDAAKAATTIAGGQFFGVVGVSSEDPSVDDVISAERVPLVTPFVTAVESRSAVSSFFIFSDLESQAMALLDFLAERAGKRPLRVAIAHDGGKLADAAAAVAAQHCNSLGWTVGKKDAEILLAIGNVDVPALAETVKAPQILIAGPSVTKSLFDLRGKTVLIAATTLPGDISEEGRGEIESFATRHHLSQGQRGTEIAAYAAVKVFVEAVRRGGRDVTRETVIASLEHLYGFATGVTPAITYGPNRHIGTVGAYIVGIDFDRRTFAPASRWITPAE